MNRHLTDATIRGLKAPATGQYDVWDAKLPGFGIRCSHGGSMTWCLLYRANGQKRRLSLGRYPMMGLAQARQAARQKLGEVASGGNPAQQRSDAKAAETFAELAQSYVKHITGRLRPRSVIENRRILDAELLPVFADRKVIDIQRRDVRALLAPIRERAPIMSNRVQALLSAMFNHAIRELDYELPGNPATGIGKSPENERDRVLSDDELRRLWQALESEPVRVAGLFKILLLTAARLSEVAGMRWTEIDFANAWWTLPRERSKNKLAHRVPLVPSAIALLHQLKNDSEFVFPGQRRGTYVRGTQKWLDGIRTRAAIPDFHYHDLRRTSASAMTAGGTTRFIAGVVLNHREAGITRVYDRTSYDREKREALERWERRLLTIVGEARESNVVELRASL